MTPRAKTAEEVRTEFLKKVQSLAQYWGNVEGKTDVEKCEGLAFSILNIFDGTSADLPAMDISLAPHESDKDYCIDNGENWYEPGMIINNCTLHESFYKITMPNKR